jgi:hypothetical protein
MNRSAAHRTLEPFNLLVERTLVPTYVNTAITQRPIALAAFVEPSGPSALMHVPSSYLVGRNDKAIPSVTQEFMDARPR